MLNYNKRLLFYDEVITTEIGNGVLKTIFVREIHNRDGKVNKMPLGVLNSFFGTLTYGKARFYSKDTDVTILPGETIYIPKGCVYTSEWFGLPQSVHFSCGFDFPYFGDGTKFALQKVPFDGEYILSRMKLINEWQEKDTFLALSAFYELCSKVFPCLSKQDKPKTITSVLPAIRFLDTSFSGDFDVSYLASLCGMSESHFYFTFKKQTGKTPIEYKNTVRCIKAVELLSRTDMTVEYISEKLNFSSPMYMRKTLMKYTGKTPRQIRRTPENTI